MFKVYKTSMDMGKQKRMDQVRVIIETYQQTKSIKATARRLKVARNTVRSYLQRAQSCNEDLREVLKKSDSELMEIFYLPDKKDDTDRERVFNSKIKYWIAELPRTGVTKYLLWEEYKLEHPSGYGYSQFCERLKREIGRRDLTIKLNHNPGECMQVDYAGKKMSWVDVSSGEVHECEILVIVLPHSQHTFAIAVKSQKVHDFIHGLNEGLLYFGKLPKVFLSDNLKSYVTKADRYDPEFNELCVQLAAHYQIDLIAARVKKPKDKASVESAVNIVYNRIYGPLRNEIYHSMEELNAGIRAQLIKHNNKRYQKKMGTRQEIFEQVELPVMRDLPSDLFEVKRITRSKVRRDYHVFIWEEKNYYSVPFQYVGKDTTVIYTSHTVEVYLGTQRIAIHDRLSSRNAYQHQSKGDHMPKSHSEWKQARGFNSAYFLRRAEQIGPSMVWAIGQVLLSRIYEVQSYNSCHGIFALSKKYSEERLEKACARCMKVGKASLSMLRRILLHNLDQEEDQLTLFSLPKHDNVRGPKAYQ